MTLEPLHQPNGGGRTSPASDDASRSRTLDDHSAPAPMSKAAESSPSGSASSGSSTEETRLRVGGASAASSAESDPPWSETLERGGCRVAETTLASGMRLIVGERHTDPIVAVLVFYGVGSVHEPAEIAGVSHFLEHMMFKGTKTVGKGEVDRLTALLGGQNNAFTGKDHTGYWFEFASDRWTQALAIEADRMANLALDPVEFEAEREVVLEELAMGLDDPWRAISQDVETLACGDHPYGRPIIGTKESVEAITREAMYAHYRSAYAPSNATVVVCGDVERDDVLAQVATAFADAARDVEPLPEPEPFVSALVAPPDVTLAGTSPDAQPAAEPALRSGPVAHRVRRTWPDEGHRLCIVWPGARCGDVDDFALDFVQTILTTGRNATMTRALVVDGDLCTYVSTANDARAHGGLFWLFAQGSNAAGEAQLEASIEAQILRLAGEGPSAAEMERAMGILVSGDAFECEGVSDVAEQLGGFALDADWRIALDGGERHRAITAEQVRDVCRRLLPFSRATVGWSLPAEEGASEVEAVDVAIDAALDAGDDAGADAIEEGGFDDDAFDDRESNDPVTS
jgi:zinc protease